MSGRDVRYRRGTGDDAHEAFQVFRQAINEFNGRTGQPLVPEQDDQSPGYLHMMRYDGERFWVAERKGRIVGFGAGLVRGDWWFLSSLFVLPQNQAGGIGRELLARAMTEAPEGGVRATITDAAQPVSNTLYARRGMLPWLPLVSYRAALVTLQARRGGTKDDGGEAPDLRAEPLTEANVGELAVVDRAVLSVDRTIDHRSYVSRGRRGWLFRRAGLAVAYAMYRPAGWIGPVACLDEHDVAAVLRYTLAALTAEHPAVVWCGVPSLNVAAQRVLLDAGFVYEAPPALLLASRAFGRLDRYLPASFGMM